VTGGLRALLADERVTHLPGVYDAVTAALAVRAGHRAAYLPWAAVSALTLGGPDLGYVPAAQMADRAATLVAALRGVPLLADADIGDGDPPHTVWTADAYLRAGISGLLLNDLVRNRRGEAAVVDAARAAASISAVAGQVPGVVVVARTGAYALHGLDGAVERCRHYRSAGAHAVCASGVDDPAELGRLHDAVPGIPLVADLGEAAASRAPRPDAALAEAGVRLVLHPTAALLAAARAASLVYRAIAYGGDAGPVDRLPWAAFEDLTAPVDAETEGRAAVAQQAAAGQRQSAHPHSPPSASQRFQDPAAGLQT
jgi:methylisocitrate lyase